MKLRHVQREGDLESEGKKEEREKEIGREERGERLRQFYDV